MLKKCGGCGSAILKALIEVQDKNNNHGLLCKKCAKEYNKLLQPESIRRFWMCGACQFRILAGTRIDAQVDPESRCPNCGTDVNLSLVNLNNDLSIKSGILGEPVEWKQKGDENEYLRIQQKEEIKSKRNQIQKKSKLKIF
jgi:hypothetical protein